jgi:hypothetical protein
VGWMECGEAQMKHVLGSYRILISFIFHGFFVGYIGPWTTVDFQILATRLVSRLSLSIDVSLNTEESQPYRPRPLKIFLRFNPLLCFSCSRLQIFNTHDIK